MTSSTIPHSRLTKRHNALSYHCVREAIAAKILAFVYKKGRIVLLIFSASTVGTPNFGPTCNPYSL